MLSGKPARSTIAFIVFAFAGSSAVGQVATNYEKPLIVRLYPNPVNRGERLYIEGKNFVPASGMKLGDDGGDYREGTYVEFATAYGAKRVAAERVLSAAGNANSICAVLVPDSAVSGKVKVITFRKINGSFYGHMSNAVKLDVFQAPAAEERKGFLPVRVSKRLAQALITSIYYHESGKITRAGWEAFQRQESIRLATTNYDVNRLQAFNRFPFASPALSQPSESSISTSNLLSAKQEGGLFKGIQFDRQRIPIYSLANLEAFKLDLDDDLHSYLDPIFEKAFGFKLAEDEKRQRSGFTRPRYRIIYSVNLPVEPEISLLSRNVGMRIDFDYVRFNPLKETTDKPLRFTIGADYKDYERGATFLFLVRFK